MPTFFQAREINDLQYLYIWQTSESTIIIIISTGMVRGWGILHISFLIRYIDIHFRAHSYSRWALGFSFSLPSLDSNTHLIFLDHFSFLKKPRPLSMD